jgi:hypothetical protein
MRTVHVRLTAGQTRALDELRLYLGRRWERGGPVTSVEGSPLGAQGGAR